MRLAWFAPDPLDDTASLVAELAATHEVERYDQRRAHDFVWQHARRPFDVCVYELSDTPAAAFLWPYLLHYPGIVRLRSLTLRDSRAHALRRARRFADSAREHSFAGRPGLRIPLVAATLAVVGDAHVARALQEEYPEARLRHAPLGVPAIQAPAPPPRPEGRIRVGVVETTALDVVERAAGRARGAGSHLDLVVDASPLQAIAESDVVLTMRWPPAADPPLAALLAMSAGRPVIVFEVGVTAAWPALDPQTWQPRAPAGGAPPVVVSIDPRDEEHSLMVAMRRLADDAPLRHRLGQAAHAWWRAHATPAAAAEAWQPLLAEAAALPPPARPPDWPPHLAADGSRRTREMLAEIGVSVDFLP